MCNYNSKDPKPLQGNSQGHMQPASIMGSKIARLQDTTNNYEKKQLK